MLRLFVYIIPYVLSIVLLIAIVNSAANFRRSQRATYFRLRRDATRGAWRWFLIAIASGGAIALSLIARKDIPPPGPDVLQFSPPTSRVTTTSTPETISLPTVTTREPAAPTKDFIVPPPTIPPTLPTPTITSTAYIATIESQVTPPPNASITITAISSGISASLEPVNTDTEFPAGTPRIYVWIDFQEMADGSSWSRVLRLNGEVIRSESEGWERGADGIAYYFFDAQGGWPTGAYEVTFFIGDKLVTSAQFSIIN